MTASIHRIPTILRETPPEQDELLADKAELEGRIAVLSGQVATIMANTAAARHAGGIDKERLRELVAELLNDEMHDARTWIDNRLEEFDR